MSKDSNLKKRRSEQSKHLKEPPPEHREIDYDLKRPVFSFHHMSYGGRYCLSQCNSNEKSAMAHHLLKISQQTWQKITSTHRKSLGYEKIPIDQFYATSFPAIVTNDINKLIVFTYSSGGRMAGIRDQDVYHIILVGTKLYDH